MIWAMDDRGIFTVKSCYKALIQDHSSFPVLDWHHVWKMNIPPKIKVFIWQVCTDCLLTADKLSQKKVECSPICPLCSNEYETTFHILAKCTYTRCCWNNMPSLPSSEDFQYCSEWFSKIFCSLDNDLSCMFCVVCWNIWQNRNNKF